MVTGLINVILEFFGKDFFGTFVVLNKWKPFTAIVLGRHVVDVVPLVVVVDDDVVGRLVVVVVVVVVMGVVVVLLFSTILSCLSIIL